MYAPRHLVFAATPRGGTPSAPRLVLSAASAADAERESDRLCAEGLTVIVAGPEQPRADDAWLVAAEVRRRDAEFEVLDDRGDWTLLPLGQLRTATLLESDARPLVRSLLLAWHGDARPVLVRSDRCGGATRDLLPDLVEACGHESVQLRRRQADAHGLTGLDSQDDALPLAMALLAQLEAPTTDWPRGLAPGRRARVWSLDAEARPLATLVAWAWWLGALAALPAVLVLLAAAGWSYSLRSLGPLAMAGLLAAWGSQRLYWSRWFDRVPGHVGPVTPAWPLASTEAGRPPLAAGYLLEGLLALGAWMGRDLDAPLGPVARALLVAAPVWALVAALAAFEASVARDRRAGDRPPRPQSTEK